MDAAEIRWRINSLVRDVVDRGRIPLGWQPRHAPTQDLPSWRVSDISIGSWLGSDASEQERQWAERLVQSADRIAAHRLSFLGLDDVDLGTPINWHREHAARRDAPRWLSSSIDYRSHAVTGDCKLVWEPNRHHHLVVLGRAFRATGSEAYAEVLFSHIDSWIEQNPFGRGMNWRSPLELGIRLISWVFAVDLARESKAFTEQRRRRISEWALLHAWDVHRKFSRGSSANNHLIGEAAAVFIGSSYFGGRDEWIRDSREVLEREAVRQTYADGFNREQAIGYHLFVLQFFLFAGLIARKAGQTFSATYWERLEAMLRFLGVLSEGGEHLPMFGDADDGYVADFGDRDDEARALLSVGAVLFERADFKSYARRFLEPARWLVGAAARSRFDSLPSIEAGELGPHAFADSGIYLLQAGQRETTTRVSLTVDCAELGYQSIAAHGHADALGLTLRAFGDDVLVDPGTYDYFTYPPWREYFRSTRAHNTATVDDEDQSVMLGPFMWGERAQVSRVEWSVGADQLRLVAEHDGYRRLPDPVMHRRSVELWRTTGRIRVQDAFVASGRHRYTLWFHFAEDCVVAESGRAFDVRTPHGRLTLTLDPALQARLLRGSESPIAGWVSRSYHRRVPAVTLAARAEAAGPVTFTSEIAVRAD